MIKREWGLLLPALLLALAPAVASEVHFSGSAYLDYWSLSSRTARESAFAGFTPELAVKIDADVHEALAFSGKVCFGCHGVEIERAYLDYTPKNTFNVQLGRIPVPFGDFMLRADPANHRAASKPLIYEMGRMAYYGTNAFNLGVVPAPYVDTGVLVYGQTWIGSKAQVWYGGYLISGLKGSATGAIDYQSMRSAYYVDNNKTPAGGGRAVVTVASESLGAVFKDISVGASGMYGRYDPQSQRAFLAVGLDVSARVGPLTLHTEFANLLREVDPAGTYQFELRDPFVQKVGFYFEVEHPLGRYLVLAYRLDGLRRVGVTFLDSDPQLSSRSSILRYTQALQVLIGDAFFAKLTYEYWRPTDYAAFHSGHLGLGGTF